VTAARPLCRRSALQAGGRFAFVGALLGLSGFSFLATAGQKPGQPAAAFTLPDLKQAATRLADLRGKVVVLDFFASWCEPCKKELPELEKLHRELSPSGVLFIGINLDREQANAVEMVKRFGLTFKVLLDPEGKVAELYDPPKMPSTYVIDKAGVLRFVNEGFDGAADIVRLRKQVSDLNR
jgi:cytochrome c biogenesis protein CcmG/thiol:disulfide interchange protein DsbE